MPTPITRETFISPDHVKVALTSTTMFELGADGESVEEVPIPPSIKETGVLPSGYSVVVGALAKQGITTVEQLPENMLEELKEQINAPNNLSIVPTTVYEQKRKLTEQASED
ncbi:hypothetical protein CVT26_009503 [Gymnopilus dilepis]|uniref:Uncharacterized protein n=1 Tax=Gymnopilus dilepis TaxID=231916 RepID=A0A409VJW1_9AGAR|nr:hypothetical protein CVT26_009503 [Gymnopilus dilepis]